MISTFLIFLAAFFLQQPQAHANKKIVLGFSQIGAESAWRIANTKSVKDAAEAAGISLVFFDAQQNQANQIKAVKTFILQKVDVIAIAPVVTTGWREVLLQAKKAKIPVILLDRQIDEKEKDLYTSFIGSDFLEEGKRAGVCLRDHIKNINRKGIINIVELRGTEGSAPALQRHDGFRQAIRGVANLKIVRSENGDFKENLAKELMEKILLEAKQKSQKIDVLFAHNDNMALGAIPAIEAAGLKPGKDVIIISVDAIRDAFLAMQAGKINCTVECSPLLGPQLMSAVKDLMSGKTIAKRIITEEGVFPQSSAAAELPKRTY